MSESFETASPAKNGRPKPQVLDRLPPHELDAEMAVIGCCLIAPKSSITRCEEKLPEGAETFYSEKHKIIFRGLIGMSNLGEDIDSITLGAWLGQRLPEIGGHQYLGECQEKTPSASNLDYYLDILLEKAIIRKIIANCTRIVSRAYEHSGNLDSLIEDLEKNVLQVSSSNQPKIAMDAKTSVQKLSDDLDRRHKLQGKLSGLDTGLYDLNKMIEGVQFGEQTIVGARPSMGKTALALKVFTNLAMTQKVPSLFISLEMSEEALMRRATSMMASVPLKVLRQGMFSEHDIEKIHLFGARYSTSPAFIVDGVDGMTCREICSLVRRMVIKYGIKFVAIDYLQKIVSDIKHDMRTYELADTSWKLKALADSTGVGLMTLAQLNRDSTKDKGRPPRLSDLAECGGIERDADTAVLIHRDENKSYLIVAKQRDGETGIVPIVFNGAFTRFENATYGED